MFGVFCSRRVPLESYPYELIFEFISTTITIFLLKWNHNPQSLRRHPSP